MADIRAIAKIKPMGDFAIADVEDIDFSGIRLDVVINQVRQTLTDIFTAIEENENNIRANSRKIDANTAAINDLRVDLSTAETAIASKASQAEVNTIKSDVATKASKAEVNAIANDVATKASTSTVSALQSDLAVQKTRMDQLVGTVPAGSADEIADARVKIDGKVASNLGNAIREQVSLMKEAVDPVSTIDEVAFNTTGYINNKGTISTEGGKWSGYIPVNPGTAIKGHGRGLNNNIAIYAFYDKDKALISAYYGTNNYEDYEVAVPEKVAYVAFTKWTSALFDDLKAWVKWNAYDYSKKTISTLSNSTELYKSIANDQSETIVEHIYDGSSKGYTCDYIAVKNCTYEIQVIEAENDNVSTWIIGEQEKSVNIIKGKPVKITAGVEGAFRFYDTKAAAGTKLKMSIRPVFVRGDEVYYAGYTLKGYVNNLGEVSGETGHRSEYIPVHGGEKIVCHARGYNNNIAIYAFFDKDKNPVSGAYYGTNSYEDFVGYVPTNAAYVIFSKLDSMTEQKAEMHWNNIMYADQIGRECGSTIDFYVGYGDNGTDHFSNLYRCFEVVSKVQGKKKIYVKGGTYDLLAQMGGMDYITSKENQGLNWRDVQPVMSNVEIVGVGNVVINFLLADRTVTDNPHLFSAINLSGNCSVENIEIHSCRCRYSIHDESGEIYPNTTHNYKNVRCYHNVDVELVGQPQAIGCGFSEGTTVNMENCILSGKYEVWSCHANEGTVLNFNNCVFITSQSENSKGLRISQNGQKNIKATLTNCYISHGISIRNEWTEPTVTDVTDITLINTKCEQIYNNYEVIEKPIVSYNTLEGTHIVLLEAN